jgi:phage repressor protein C with HTH and peptisase S24 domain
MFSSHNVKKIRELYGLTQEQLAVSLSLTRELINKIEKGKAKVSKGTSLRLEKFVRERESEFYSHDATILGQPVTSEVSSLPYHLQRREQKVERKTVWVPLVGVKAQAGYVKGYEQVDFIESLDKYSLPPGVHPGGAQWSYFEIDGDSMEPTFSSSDVILASMVHAEDWQEIKNLCVYVILTADSLLVKRIIRKSSTEWILVSDNTEVYPHRTILVSDIKELWIFRRHIHSKVSIPEHLQSVL